MFQKNLKMYIAVAIFVIILVIGIRWYQKRTQSKYTYSDIQAGTQPPETNTYSNIVQCQVTYNTANIYATAETRPALLTTFTECVRSNVTGYVDTKCVWVSNDPTTVGAVVGNTTTTSAHVTAYNQYTSDTRAIQAAYMDLLTRATATATATTPALSVVNAGLKADLTGATRRYLATVCTDYFKTPTNDLTSTYSSWSVAPSASAAPTAYSFYASGGKITKAQVDTWAAKAADYTVDATTSEFTVGTPYLASGSTYMSDSTFSGVKNWEIARDNGPGTINPQP